MSPAVVPYMVSPYVFNHSPMAFMRAVAASGISPLACGPRSTIGWLLFRRAHQVLD